VSGEKKITNYALQITNYFKALTHRLHLSLAYGWALQGLKVDLALLKNSLPYVTDFVSRLFPPNLEVLDVAIAALIETVQMSLWGTTIGAFLSLPIAIASAHNIAPPFCNG
jgi:phosphonate transport system permease protein